MDMVFANAANDLVVPETGVYDSNGNGAFPIPEMRLYRVPNTAGIIHTTVFAYPAVSSKLLEWF
jgi:hypothetical protein